MTWVPVIDRGELIGWFDTATGELRDENDHHLCWITDEHPGHGTRGRRRRAQRGAGTTSTT